MLEYYLLVLLYNSHHCSIPTDPSHGHHHCPPANIVMRCVQTFFFEYKKLIQIMHLCAAPLPRPRPVPVIIIVFVVEFLIILLDILVSSIVVETFRVGDTIDGEGEDTGTPGVWA